MDEALLINLVVRGIFGAIIGAIAHSRGRNGTGWFFIGVLFVCFGLILVLVLPDLKKEDSRRDRLRRDNQRLRERINKERQVSDERHAETTKRLGAHDAVLGVETSKKTATPPKLTGRGGSKSSPLDKSWHYAMHEDADEEGPVSLDGLRDLWRGRAITEDSLVWTSGMDDWLPIRELTDLVEDLNRG